MVDGIAQQYDFVLCQTEDRAQTRHRCPGLLTGQIKGHAHLGGVFGKAQQFLAGNAGLASRGDDGANTVGRHRDARRHQEHVFAHLAELIRRVKVHHLLHIGHHRLEGNRWLHQTIERATQSQRIHYLGAVAAACLQILRLALLSADQGVRPGAQGVQLAAELGGLGTDGTQVHPGLGQRSREFIDSGTLAAVGIFSTSRCGTRALQFPGLLGRGFAALASDIRFQARDLLPGSAHGECCILGLTAQGLQLLDAGLLVA